MPVLDGVQATNLIVEANPAARVIILTMYRQDRYVFEAIKAGARGYLLKDIDEQDLVAAIRAVQRNKHSVGVWLGGWPGVLVSATVGARVTNCSEGKSVVYLTCHHHSAVPDR